MAFDPVTGNRCRDQAGASDNWLPDHRARIALEESELLERKQQELLQQTSELSTPAERIRIWERRHGLTLPRDAHHRIVSIVASQTDLALEQVREEQQRRLARTNEGRGVPTERRHPSRPTTRARPPESPAAAPHPLALLAFLERLKRGGASTERVSRRAARA